MTLKDAMEQVWQARELNSAVLKARWRRKYDQAQGELRLEAKSQTALQQRITVVRELGKRRPR